MPLAVNGLLRRVAFCLVAAAAFAAPAAAKKQPADPIVQVSGGKIMGTREDGVFAFKGVPYAAAPVGERRWAPPAPVKSWRGVRRADKIGAACIQKPGLSEANGGYPGPISEDCLFLNVWTPTADASAKLPVVVWIHGGAYVFGSGGVAGYSGAPSAKKGVVYVSLNYRLGALGFFAHPATLSRHGGAMNFGLLDQVAALEWVQANIAKFGGDPSNVTIMGQSAGGKSVMAHIASPLSRGLFHKAVAMSVYVLPDATPEKAGEVAAAVASGVGLDGGKASLKSLLRVPAKRFADIDDNAAALGPTPIIGDAMTPQSIAETFRKGDEARIPLIMGNTSDDGSVIAAFGVDPAALVKQLGAAGIGLKLLYPNMSEEERARQALRDIVFTMNPRWVADNHAKRASTWRYYYDYVAENDRTALPNGAPHGYEVPFMLDTLEYTKGGASRYTQADRAIASGMSEYLIAFAKTGEPSSAVGPEWPSDAGLRDIALVADSSGIKTDRNFMTLRLNALIAGSKIVDNAIN
ncbi:MAG: carboxylesterase/lipase family protein [Parvularculaceae bacterium]